MLQTLPFAAGGRQINAKATFFRYEIGNSAGLDNSIRLRADGNDLGIFWPGDAVELPEPATVWTITPTINSTTGQVRLGVGRVQSARLVGSVYVIDNGAQKVLDGRQNISVVSSPAVAGQVSALGMYAGTRTTSIRSFAISSTTAGPVAVGFSTSRGTALGTTQFPVSKLNGAAGALHRAAFGTAAGSVPTAGEMPGWSAFGIISLQANTPFQLVTKDPIVISGEYCLAVIGQTVNRDLFAVCESEEIV